MNILSKITRNYRASFEGLPAGAWLLALIILVNRSGSMVLFFMTLYLTSEKGFTSAEAGGMLSLYGSGSLLGAFGGGWLTDIWGPLKVQLISLILTAVGLFYLGVSESSVLIGFLLFFIAAVSDAFRPANAAALSKVCPPHVRARGFALNRLAVNLGITIGPAIGGMLATISYIYIFWIDGITCLLAAILLIYFYRDLNIEKEPPKASSGLAASPPWRDGIFMVILFLTFSLGLVFTQIFNTWPLYLRDINGFTEDRIGLLLAINGLLIVIFEMPLVHRLEKKDAAGTMVLGALFLFAGFSMLPLSGSFIFVAFTVIIWTIGEMLVFPITLGFIANRSNDANRGRYMGMFTFTFSLAFVTGPALGTWIYDKTGADTIWYLIAIAGSAVLLVFRALFKYQQRRELAGNNIA